MSVRKTKKSPRVRARKRPQCPGDGSSAKSCRKKTKGPRYGYYCEDHKHLSKVAQAAGLVPASAQQSEGTPPTTSNGGVPPSGEGAGLLGSAPDGVSAATPPAADTPSLSDAPTDMWPTPDAEPEV